MYYETGTNLCVSVCVCKREREKTNTNMSVRVGHCFHSRGNFLDLRGCGDPN